MDKDKAYEIQEQALEILSQLGLSADIEDDGDVYIVKFTVVVDKD